VARVFITGSSDGLGRMAARVLIEQGHEVVVHGRNDGRTRDALEAAAGARAAVTGDLSTIAGARTVDGSTASKKVHLQSLAYFTRFVFASFNRSQSFHTSINRQ
jgi:NAD(P)-dependent dehydrogenase (short-subunit alcohol dehydrogenase family)